MQESNQPRQSSAQEYQDFHQVAVEPQANITQVVSPYDQGRDSMVIGLVSSVNSADQPSIFQAEGTYKDSNRNNVHNVRPSTQQYINSIENPHAIMPRTLQDGNHNHQRTTAMADFNNGNMQSNQQQSQQKNQRPRQNNSSGFQSSGTNHNLNNNVGVRPPRQKSQTAIAGQRRMRKQRRQQNPSSLAPTEPKMNATGGFLQNSSQGYRTEKAQLPAKRHQIYSLLQQVEILQGQIQKLPEGKGRHYFNPYTKIGQASNLNLAPQSAQKAEQIAEREALLRKEEIQRKAQLLLQQIEREKGPSSILSPTNEHVTEHNANIFENQVIEVQCNCDQRPLSQTPTDENASEEHLCDMHRAEKQMRDTQMVGTEGGLQPHILEDSQEQDGAASQDINNQSQNKVSRNPFFEQMMAGKAKDDGTLPESRHSHCSLQVQCGQCGHVCVTNTEQTSEAPPLNQVSFDLEDIKGRRENLSSLATGQVIQQHQPAQQEVDQSSTDAAMTQTAEAQDANIAQTNQCCKLKGRYSKNVKCGQCGSKKVIMKDLQKQVNQMESESNFVKNMPKKRLNAISSERYVHKQGAHTSKAKGIFEQTHYSSPHAYRTSQVSVQNQIKADKNADSMPQYGAIEGDRLLSGPGNGTSSVQYMASKNGSNSHHDLGQINLQISNNQKDLLFNINRKNAADHNHSQPKIIHKTFKNSNATRPRSLSRSKSQSRSKSKKSIKMGDGNIMCGKCAIHHAPPQVVKKRKSRLVSAKMTERTGIVELDEYCPVHGFREVHDTDSATEMNPTRRVLSDYKDVTVHINNQHIQDPQVCDSDSAKTDEVDLASRKIRDSIEFTSQTHSAKNNFSLQELNNDEQEKLSEALISELRAIANGNFALGSDPIIISAQASDATYRHHTRINLLSLGAYTAKAESNAPLDAQSNIATNEVDSQHQTSLMLHSELGSKQYKSNVQGTANGKASGAYGSELQYSDSNQYQKGGYPLKQMLVNEEDEEEEFEEEFEEELEEELSQEQLNTVPDFPEDDPDEINSHATSFSDMYVIDEKEESRLKQIAFEKYMAEKAIEAKAIQRKQDEKDKLERKAKRLQERKANAHKKIKTGKQTIEVDGSPVKVDVDVQRIELLEQDGSSIELIDRSQQCSKQESSKAEPEQKQLINAGVNVMSPQNQNANISAVPEDQTQAIFSNRADLAPSIFTTTHAKGSQREFQNTQQSIGEEDDEGAMSSIADNISNKTGATCALTVKAFRPEILYEEANVQINDSASIVTRQQFVIKRDYAESQPKSIMTCSQDQIDAKSGITSIRGEVKAAQVKFSADQIDVDGVIALENYAGQSATDNGDYTESVTTIMPRTLIQPDMIKGQRSEPGILRGMQSASHPNCLSEDHITENAQANVVNNVASQQQASVTEITQGNLEVNSNNAFAIDESKTIGELSQQRTAFRMGTIASNDQIEPVIEQSRDVANTEQDQEEQDFQKLNERTRTQLNLSRNQDQNATDVLLSNENRQREMNQSQPHDAMKQLLTETGSAEQKSTYQNDILIANKTIGSEERNRVLSQGTNDYYANQGPPETMGYATDKTPTQPLIFVDKQVQFPGSEIISPKESNSTPAAHRSRKSHRRLPSAVVMVDRSQQDSRGSQKGTMTFCQMESLPSNRMQSNTINLDHNQTIQSSLMQQHVNQSEVEDPRTNNNSDYEPLPPRGTTSIRPMTQQVSSAKNSEYQPMSDKRKMGETAVQIYGIDYSVGEKVPSSQYVTGNGDETEPHFQQPYSSGGGDESEPPLPGAGIDHRKSRQEQTAIMQTGDENEPQPPNIMEGTGVNFTASEKEPSIPQVTGDRHENADDYVKRMMAEKGLSYTAEEQNSDKDVSFDQTQDKNVSKMYGDEAHKYGQNLDDESIQNQSIKQTIRSSIVANEQEALIQTGFDSGDAKDEVPPESADFLPQNRIKKPNHNWLLLEQKQRQSQDAVQANAMRDQNKDIQEENDEAEGSVIKSAEKNKENPHKDGQYSIRSMDNFHEPNASNRDRTRSPKAYQIKTNNMRKGKSQNIFTNTQQKGGQISARRPHNAHDASYFVTKGEHSIKKLIQQQETLTKVDYRQHTQSPSETEQINLNINRGNSSRITTISKARLKQQSDLYERSPRAAPMILAQNDSSAVNHWDESTEVNIRNFIQQRAQKRIKEINKEVEMVKPGLFNKPNIIEQTTALVEAEYLRQGASHSSLSHYDHYNQPNALPKTSRTQAGRQKKGDRIHAYATNDEQTMMRLASGGQLRQSINNNQFIVGGSDDQMMKFVHSETKNSLASFDQGYTKSSKKYQTLTKANNQREMRDLTNQDSKLPMSNFSAHYHLAKSKLGKSQERRNIPGSRLKQNLMASDLYFPDQLDNIEVTHSSHYIARNRILDSQHVQNAAKLKEELNQSMPPQVNTRQGNHDRDLHEALSQDYNYESRQQLSNRKQRTSSSNSAHYMLNKLKQPPYGLSTQTTTDSRQARLPVTSQKKKKITDCYGRGDNSLGQRPSMMQQQQQLQFYPTTGSNVKKQKANNSRLNGNLAHVKTGSSLNNRTEFGLKHDNSHAPFLGPKHLKTTAYL